MATAPSPAAHAAALAAELSASRKELIAIHNQLKSSRTQHTFDFISQCLVLGLIVAVVYYNGLMLLPHVTPILWALLWAVFLHKPLKFATSAIASVDAIIAPIRTHLYCGSLALYVLLLLTSGGALLSVVIATALFSLWTFLLWGNRSTVAAVLCLTVSFSLLALPTFLFIKSCVVESHALVVKVKAFVDENPQFQTALDDFGNSPYYKWAEGYAKEYGVDLPPFDAEVIKTKVTETAMQFSDQFTSALGGVLAVLADSVSVLASFVTFASSLFLFLQTPDSAWVGALRLLSPFSDNDTNKLVTSLNRSVVSVFVSSFAVGFSHMIGTYIVFSLVGIDISLILSFICGVTSMLPLISSWVVWVPVAVGLYATGSPFHAVLVVTVQIALSAGDGIIYSMIPGNDMLVGTSLAMGLYVFGSLGLILGPLFAGILVTIIELYCSYQGPTRTALAVLTASARANPSGPAAKVDQAAEAVAAAAVAAPVSAGAGAGAASGECASGGRVAAAAVPAALAIAAGNDIDTPAAGAAPAAPPAPPAVDAAGTGKGGAGKGEGGVMEVVGKVWDMVQPLISSSSSAPAPAPAPAPATVPAAAAAAAAARASAPAPVAVGAIKALPAVAPPAPPGPIPSTPATTTTNATNTTAPATAAAAAATTATPAAAASAVGQKSD